MIFHLIFDTAHFTNGFYTCNIETILLSADKSSECILWPRSVQHFFVDRIAETQENELAAFRAILLVSSTFIRHSFFKLNQLFISLSIFKLLCSFLYSTSVPLSFITIHLCSSSLIRSFIAHLFINILFCLLSFIVNHCFMSIFLYLRPFCSSWLIVVHCCLSSLISQFPSSSFVLTHHRSSSLIST